MDLPPDDGRVLGLVSWYRRCGHLRARFQPLPAEAAATEPPDVGLPELAARLAAGYCGAVGVELDDVDVDPRQRWLAEEIEAGALTALAPPEARRGVYQRLVEVAALESFLQRRFLGATRFSLEGTDALVPLIDALADELAGRGAGEILVGTSHRGRLTLLACLGGLERRALLDLFQPADGAADADAEKGDVRYHLGGTGRRGEVRLIFTPIPSHVEWGHPVLAGRARARQDARGERRSVVPLLLHGDGAFMGQGVAAETLNLGRLAGYGVGGTVHVVVNNQVAFTTRPGDGRSSRYATDMARVLRVPVLHVNADDCDAVVAVARLAAAYRDRHQDDVVIDLVGYRRRGHSETDEPRLTLPLEYAAIDRHPGVRRLHGERLMREGVLTAAEAEAAVQTEEQAWQRALAGPRPTAAPAPAPPARPVPARAPVSARELADLAARLAALPPGFAAPAKVAAQLTERARRAAAGDSLDWAAAETLAFATLLADGVAVRLSGQDSRRGTFAQRHAVVVDERSGAPHVPLAALGRFEVHDSPLSEAAVLGFEHGYSLEAPDALVLWEAQYGDFANGAQVIIDQFIAAGAAKWGQPSGLVLLLPHGHEGQGPEHSSARLERFLALCAGDNLRVCQPTTAAQLFHLLRSQAGRAAPLVVLTPKGQLRAPWTASPAADLARGGFAPVLPDDEADAEATRIVLSSGRVHHDLLEARGPDRRTALPRLEQLHPLGDELAAALGRFAAGTPLVWVQEEPRNMGAWSFLATRLPELLQGRFPLRCVARDESASPATGSARQHRREQAALVAAALYRGA